MQQNIRNKTILQNKKWAEPEPIQGARFIQLGNNKFALVDEEDFEIINSYNWYFHNGYARKSYDSILMHSFIMSPSDKFVIDHINHNGLDNRKNNLRICTVQENLRNKHKQTKINGTASRFKGVGEAGNNWRSSIYINSKRLHLGCYELEIEAALAYDQKAIELFGEFALTNKMLGLL